MSASRAHPPQPSADEIRRLLQSTSSVAPGRGPLRGVLVAIYDDLIQELLLDLCIHEHKQAHLQSWPRGTLQAPPTITASGSTTSGVPGEVDVFGLAQLKKVPERSFKCESCGQKSGSSKYAAHLEKCTGKGGRASSRRNKQPPPPPIAATAAAAPSASSAANSQAQASLAATLAKQSSSWEDDAEIIAASGVGGPATGSTMNGRQQQHVRHGLSTVVTSPAIPSPSAAGGHQYRNSSPHVAGTSGHPHANTSNSHHLTTSSSLSSPYTVDGSPMDDISPNGTSYSNPGQVDQSWPGQAHPSQTMHGDASSSSSGLLGHAGQKRKPLDLSGLENKKRRPTLKADDFWTGPLPPSVPINVADGGLPYMVVGGECHLGTSPSSDQLSEMLARVCGVPSHSTWKMCSNKPACSMHTEEDRQTTRQGIRDGAVFVRFKRVAPTAVKPKKVAAATGAGGNAFPMMQQQQQQQQQHQAIHVYE